MSHSTTRPPRRPSGGERVFADDVGRLWSASHVRTEEPAVVFSCISDSRQAARALAVDASFRIADVSDETLRAWLREAPRMGRLI
jgi:hypothetical protein